MGSAFLFRGRQIALGFYAGMGLILSRFLGLTHSLMGTGPGNLLYPGC